MLVRHQSLTAAGDVLDINYTTVARRIKRAEDSLKQPLFERMTDGYRPTETALLLAEHAAHMEDAEHNLMRRLQGSDTELSGMLTITAPQLLIASFLAPVIDRFVIEHPKVELRVLATNDLLDLTRREADIAIRVSDNPGDSLTGLRLLSQQTTSFCSPHMATRITANPSEMINWIVYDNRPDVPEGIAPDFPNNRVHLRFDDIVAMIGAAQAGLGVVRMPFFVGRSAGGLVQVPVLPPQTYPDIWIVGHPDVWPSKKVRAFRDVLVKSCKADRHKFIA